MEEKYEKIKKYFDVSDQFFYKLIELDHKKEEIKKLREQNGRLKNPLIITVTGTPRSGKATCICNLFEFFKKANFKTSFVNEPAGLIYDSLKSKEEKEKLLKHRVKFVDKQYDIGLNMIKKCINENNEGKSKELKCNVLKEYVSKNENKIVLLDDDNEILKYIKEEIDDIDLYQDSSLID